MNTYKREKNGTFTVYDKRGDVVLNRMTKSGAEELCNSLNLVSTPTRMNQNNSREGFGKKAEIYAREFCKKTPRIKPESGVAFYERLQATIFNILATADETLHQELQKAREEERKQLHNRLTGWEVAISTGEEDIDALTLCKELHKALIQSELDQPTKIHNCIECGEPVDTNESVKNCHGSCRLEL